MPRPNNIGSSGFSKISDLARMISLIIILFHFYHFCHPLFLQWHLTLSVLDKMSLNIHRIGLLDNPFKSKILVLGFLAVCFIGHGNRLDGGRSKKWGLVFAGTDLLIYFGSNLVFQTDIPLNNIFVLYLLATSFGYLLLIATGGFVAEIFQVASLKDDVFNAYNETFPQQESLIENEFSINLRAKYRYKDQIRKSWINIVNPMRGILVCGTPGSGKTHFVVEQIIEQHIRKGFAMVIYDFKYPDLSELAYRCYIKYKKNYPVEPEFHYLDFDNPGYSHRCNFLHPGNLTDISDAAEFSRAFLLGLNKEWIEKQGDFWVESPINLLTAIIWFLRKYENGRFCSLPHAIELLQADYGKLFSILSTQPEIETYINPFKTAYLTESTKQLQGQVDGLKIAVARISSPSLYYILTGDDFSLAIANPEKPQILCIGNSPQKSQIYGAVISLYLSAVQRLLFKTGNIKSHLILEEFPTVYLNAIDKMLALSRSYKVAITLVIQNYNQLQLYYGRSQADVIFNLPGNVLCGQSYGETAKFISDRIGRILQNKESIAIHESNQSVNHSLQLDYAVPHSTIAKLGIGEMVGLVPGNADQKDIFKAFHAQLHIEQGKYREGMNLPRLPKIRKIEESEIKNHFLKVKRESVDILSAELKKMMESPELAGLIVTSNSQ